MATRTDTAVQRALLRWYASNRRPLPWRKTRDPYRIWVSEILLQQTRVGTAEGYYERFVARFPTVDALARASVDDVLQVWQGLGYYGRARNLHRAAGQVVERFGGRLPATPGELRKLPGIGPYTAAAIASIAFGLDAAVVDGNVARVLCRLRGIDDDPKEPAARERIQAEADALLPRGRAGAFNQAVMELGALVCTPRQPRCEACPVAGFCEARRTDRVHLLPRRAPTPTVPTRVRIVAAVGNRGRYLFTQRPPSGLLGGLWELPGEYVATGEESARAASRLMGRLRKVAEVKRLPAGEAITLEHVYSHFRESLEVVRCTGRRRSDLPLKKRHAELAHRWFHPTSIRRWPVTGATRKILERLAGP